MVFRLNVGFLLVMLFSVLSVLFGFRVSLWFGWIFVVVIGMLWMSRW